MTEIKKQAARFLDITDEYKRKLEELNQWYLDSIFSLELQNEKCDPSIGQKVIAICELFKIRVEEVYQKTRRQPITSYRHIILYALHKYGKYSLKTIGREFDRDHTTVISSCNVVNDWICLNQKHHTQYAVEKSLIETARDYLRVHQSQLPL